MNEQISTRNESSWIIDKIIRWDGGFGVCLIGRNMCYPPDSPDHRFTWLFHWPWVGRGGIDRYVIAMGADIPKDIRDDLRKRSKLAIIGDRFVQID